MPKKTPNNQQFSVQQSALSKALNICSKALSDNRIIPAYEMFLFRTNGNALHVSSCDGQILIETSIETMEQLPKIDLMIPGRDLLDYISKSDNELLTFGIETEITPEVREMQTHPMSGDPYEVVTPGKTVYNLHINGKSSKSSLPCENGEDFPTIQINPVSEFTIPAADFSEMLNKTMFAISNDQLRPSATGLNISVNNGRITCTSLNFDIVATYTFDIPGLDELPETSFIIPKKALQQIQGLNPTGIISFQISKSAISLSFGDVRATGLLIDERYPDYLSVTPNANHINFVTSRTALLKSLKRILGFSDSGKFIKMDVGTDIVILTADNLDYKKRATETIPGMLDTGSDGIVIGVSGEYLISILNTLKSDEVWFSMSEPNRAMIITDGVKHVNPGKENLVLLMPLMIN